MTIVWHSATGNTLALARMIAAETEDARLIPLLSLRPGATVSDSEAVCIAVPVMCGTIPPAAARTLSSVKIEAPVIAAVATYGYIPGRALLDLAALLPGASLFYGVKAPDSCLTVRNPVSEASRLNQLDLPAKAREIAAGMAEGRILKARASVADRLSALFGTLFNVGVVAAKDIRMDCESCTGCRSCERVCPRSNIAVVDGKAVIGTECDGCMACVNICPSSALHLKGEKEPRYRYRHPDTGIYDVMIRC